MSEKQPTAFVVCRERVSDDGDGMGNIPVKVYDDRKDARLYVKRMNARSRRYRYAYYPVKQG